ncbi:MFS general substrate transporter [Lichtheimia hyalospora FSU 10163]|nr:MFS general substrate transporter [Lichtheimia hyalospora FSU 10163]
MMIGNVICPLGLFLASATTQLWQVYLTQGLLFGLGGGFCFNASFILPSQWFVRNRGLANGIGNTGVAFGGMVFSPLANYLIQTLGYRNALRVMGCIVFALLALGTALARARYPPPSPKPSNESIISCEASTTTSEENNNEKSQTSKKHRSCLSSPLISVPFGLFMVFALLAPLGYLIPFYLMPTYATQVVGASESMGSALVSIGNAANIICRIALGFTADRIGQTNTLFTTTLISGIITMVMWQFSNSLAVYGVYCALVGLTAGAYISLMPSVVALLVGMGNLYSGVAMSWVLMSVGSLLGTPMFGLMQQKLGWTASRQFAGAATVVSALCMLAVRIMLDKRPFVKI